MGSADRVFGLRAFAAALRGDPGATFWPACPPELKLRTHQLIQNKLGWHLEFESRVTRGWVGVRSKTVAGWLLVGRCAVCPMGRGCVWPFLIALLRPFFIRRA